MKSAAYKLGVNLASSSAVKSAGLFDAILAALTAAGAASTKPQSHSLMNENKLLPSGWKLTPGAFKGITAPPGRAPGLSLHGNLPKLYTEGRIAPTPGYKGLLARGLDRLTARFND